MSGAAIRCCRICGHHLESQADRIEGTTLEFLEWCPKCLLYHHTFAYGATEERVGVITSNWTYDESGPGNWREQEAEAKRIWRDETSRALAAALRGTNDATPWLVMADWCDDNDCPLSAAYLRGTTREPTTQAAE